MKQALMLGLLFINSCAGACSVMQSPPDPSIERWQSLLKKSRGQNDSWSLNGSEPTKGHINLDEATLYGRLTAEGVKQFEACPAEITNRYQSEKLPLMACEIINRPFAEVRAAAVKAYKQRLVYQGSNTLKFNGAGGSWALGGDFWNGTQLTLLPQQEKTLLVWQSLGKEVVANRLKDYMDDRINKYEDSHPKYFDDKSRPRLNCKAFGVINQNFFKFKECYALEQPLGTMPNLLI